MDSASLTIFVGLNFRGQSLVNYFRAFKFLMVKRELTRFFSVVRNMAEITFFACESSVRGYHIYQEIWEASCGQTFPCLREEGNPFDPFAVSVVRTGDIIGHVPRRISAACSLFLWNGGSIQCTVTGS